MPQWNGATGRCDNARTMITLLATIVALKFVEGSGSLEFDGWDGVIGAAVACWLGAWAAQSVMELTLLEAEPGHAPSLNPWLGQAILGASTMISLLVAWAVLPGVHVRRFYGLVLAAVLVAGFTFLANMLMSGAVGSLL